MVRARPWMMVVASAVMAAACSHEREPVDGADRRALAVEVGEERELDPPTLVPAAGEQGGSVVVHDGLTYLVVWSDGREFFGSPEVPFPPPYAARVSGDGTVLDPTGFPVAPAGWFARDGACDGAGTCLFLLVDPAQTVTTAVRISAGQVLDPVPLPLVNGFASSVAWDGSAFRIVWVELVGTHFVGWTARVSVDGELGPAIQVGGGTSEVLVHNFSLACAGPRCLIVYNRQPVPGANVDAMGRLVDSAGVVGDEFVISDEPGTQWASEPFWDGERFWVGVRHGEYRGSNVRVSRVDTEGVVLDPAGILLDPGAPGFGKMIPSMVHDGATTIAAWTTEDTIGRFSVSGARITDDGTVLDPGGVTLPHGGPAACASGECLAVRTAASFVQRDVRGMRMAGLTPLDPEDFAIARTPPAQLDAAIASGAGRYMAVWTDSRVSPDDARMSPVRGALFPPALEPAVPVTLGVVAVEAVCPYNDQPAVAATTSSYFVAWRDRCELSSGVQAQVVDLDGAPVAPAFRLDATNLDEAHPALASSGDQVLAMWESEEPEPPIWTVRGTRFDANGAVLGTERFVIAGNARAPEAAFDGTNYVVVWIHNGVAGGTSLDVRAARVAADGTVLDPDGITLAATVRRENEQSVACGGGVCLVVWREGPANVRGARLAPDGTVLDPGGILVGQVVGADRATAVTFDGQSFVVGWRTGEGSEIRGVQVSPDGAVLPPGEVLLAATDSPADNPALGSTGAGSAVLLYDRFDSSPPWRVRRLRARSIGGLAGWPDAGPPGDVDAASPPPDAASPDAASLPDAAPPDAASLPDAALPDAASLPDASTPADASSPPPDAAGNADTDSGGCQTAPGAGTTFTWLLLAAGWLARRRRRRG